jgi:DNA-binding transcriptional regulator GbsR (MarR family)
MALSAIAKNTGLPEFTKLENSERFKEITRNKFFGVVNDNLFQSRDKFVSNFITNAKKKIGNKISETVGNIRNVISEIESGAEQLQSGAELMEQVGEDIKISKTRQALSLYIVEMTSCFLLVRIFQ